MIEFICADCGHEQNTIQKCEKCQSFRVILLKVAKELFGENYKDCFDPEKNK